MKYSKPIPLILFLFNVGFVNAQLVYSNLFVQYDSAQAWTFKKLQLIPIKFKGNAGNKLADNISKDILSFSEALKTKKITVKEVNYNNGADVNMLVIKNHSKKNILVNSGEILSGGKQDRVIGKTMIIPPTKEETYLPVYCVEKGRWDKKAKPFLHAGNADMALRKKIDLNKRQAEIWKKIEEQFASRNKKSDTYAYLQLYKNASAEDSAYVNFFMNKFRRSDSAYAGFAIVIGNRIIGCELFCSQYYTTAFYKEMITSYIHSVSPFDEEPNVKYIQLKEFLDPLLQTEESQKSFLKTHGKADKYGNKTIHLIAYGD
jgi:hypothetical protein